MMTAEHFDVLVVGAGISGIGAGYHLQTMCPDRTYAILEGPRRHRRHVGPVPLPRRPLRQRHAHARLQLQAVDREQGDRRRPVDPRATSARPTAEYGIDRHIRFGHLVTRAEWSSDDARWTRRGPPHGHRRDRLATPAATCSCARATTATRAATRPSSPASTASTARSCTPRRGPRTSTTAGKRVVVIGSGATAMTLVPAMADTAGPRHHAPALAHLRGVAPRHRPRRQRAAQGAAREGRLQPDPQQERRPAADDLQAHPHPAREGQGPVCSGMVRKELGPDYDVDTHFTPSYNPWDQRLCLVPNSDLFEAIRSGKASVVTDEIVTFTETGIELASGEELEADIIVTATGLQLVTLGEMDFVVDGEPVDFAKTWTYKGFAYSDVPNLASSFGYINASWTLRADLTCEYVCRLLNHMTETGTVQCTPRLRPSDRSMPERPWIDDFSAGYMQRVMHRFPRQGDREPWINPQNYTRDKKMFRKAPVDDGVMQFSRAKAPAAAATP